MKNRKTMNTTVVPIEARGNKSKVNPKSPEDFSRGPKKNPVIERKTTATPINNRKGAPVERVDRFQVTPKSKPVITEPNRNGTIKKVDRFQAAPKSKPVITEPGKKTVNNNNKVNLRNNK